MPSPRHQRPFPEDAAHVLGLHDSWDGDAARKGAALFARKQTNRLEPVDVDADAVARRTIDTLIRTSAETLLECALAEDGFTGEGLSRHQLTVATIEGSSGLVHFDMKINVPVIGLGASAPAYYPDVAAVLKTSALVPGHAGVANAIGAVVGRVRIAAEATVVQPQSGLFRVHTPESQKDFAALESAIAFAEEIISASATSQAVEAGADNVKVKWAREDKRAIIEG